MRAPLIVSTDVKIVSDEVAALLLETTEGVVRAGITHELAARLIEQLAKFVGPTDKPS